MIRAFVALPLPEAMQLDLVLLQQGLPGFRGVAQENLHLTLAFLGAQPEPVLEDLNSELERFRARSFDLRLAGMGRFGHERGVTIWAGVASDPALTALQAKVVQAARMTGISLPHRRFVPHVTLFRLGTRGGAEADAFVATRFSVSGAPVRIEAFALMRSTLGKRGPTYDELARYSLG